MLDHLECGGLSPLEARLSTRKVGFSFMLQFHYVLKLDYRRGLAVLILMHMFLAVLAAQSQAASLTPPYDWFPTVWICLAGGV
jgi:hypothetical protein